MNAAPGVRVERLVGRFVPMKKYLQVVALLVVAVAVFGWGCPLLVSAANTEAVFAGFVLMVVSIPALIIMAKKIIFPKEKKNEEN